MSLPKGVKANINSLSQTTHPTCQPAKPIITSLLFFSLSKLPLIKLVMAPIKVAASMVGATSLTQTMEAGYTLTSNIKDHRPFIKILIERETKNVEDPRKIII